MMFRWKKQIEEISFTLDAPEQSEKVGQLINVIERFNQPTHLRLKTMSGIATLELETIILFDVQGGTLTVKTVRGVYETKTTLRSLINQLPAQFIQISRNTVINIDHLIEIRRSYSGNYTGVLVADNTVNISRRAVKALKERLKGGEL